LNLQVIAVAEFQVVLAGFIIAGKYIRPRIPAVRRPREKPRGFHLVIYFASIYRGTCLHKYGDALRASIRCAGMARD